MDDERLKGNGGGTYWKELLDCIRDIRSIDKEREMGTIKHQKAMIDMPELESLYLVCFHLTRLGGG